MTTLALLLALATAAAAPSAPGSAQLRAAKRLEAMIDRGELEEARKKLEASDYPPLLEATLRGRLALAEDRPDAAVRAFRKASKLAPDHAPLKILLAHAQVAAGQHRAALRTLGGTGIDRSKPGVALLLAAAQRDVGDPASAYATLRRAAEANPGHAGLHRQLVVLCATEGLFETAKAWAQRHTPAQLGADAAAIALRQARLKDGGLSFARWLAAAFPNDAAVQAELGWVESGAGEYGEAARALSRAAKLGADTAFAAAEHYRAARRYREALAANAGVANAKRRAQQRFDILFEDGKPARATVAGGRLEDAGWLDPRRRYNLAYAHYALREFAEATRHARALSGTAESRRAAALLKAMGR